MGTKAYVTLTTGQEVELGDTDGVDSRWRCRHGYHYRLAQGCLLTAKVVELHRKSVWSVYRRSQDQWLPVSNGESQLLAYALEQAEQAAQAEKPAQS